MAFIPRRRKSLLAIIAFFALISFIESKRKPATPYEITKDNPLLLTSNRILRKHAAIVIEKYKLIYITNPKTGSSVLKRLLWLMSGNSEHLPLEENVHTKKFKYLNNYHIDTANEMLKDPTWTKAIFIRDPKERILSAYLDKIHFDSKYFLRSCCNAATGECRGTYKVGFEYFIKTLSLECKDLHWSTQKSLLDGKFWRYINFVGDFRFMESETKRLLIELGGNAWRDYGKSGWGNDGTSPVFSQRGIGPVSSAKKDFSIYYTPELEKIVEQRFKEDYSLIRKYFDT